MATRFEYDHLEAAGNPIIPRGSPYEGERFDRFRDMATQGKAHGALMVGQVSHPGRQVESRIQKNPVSASDVQLEGNIMGMTFAKPHAASDAEIKGFVEGWAHAAEYLEKAGWDGIVSLPLKCMASKAFAELTCVYSNSTALTDIFLRNSFRPQRTKGRTITVDLLRTGLV